MIPTIETLLTSLLHKKDDWRIYLMRNWSAVVGKLHTKMCLEKICEDNTLIIGVHDAHWMQELYYLSGDLVATINKNIGGSHVQKVRFVLSRTKHIPKKVKIKPLVMQKATMAPREKQLTDKQARALQLIDDVQLQEMLQHLMQRAQ